MRTQRLQTQSGKCCPASPRVSRRVVIRAANGPQETAGDHVLSRVQDCLPTYLQKAGALACAASLLLSSPAVADDLAGGQVLRLPASDNPEVFQSQQTLFEAWNIVGESFVDDNFNGHYWPEELKSHMMAAYNSKDGNAAYGEIAKMLEDLGDPYTHIIPPKDYADFRVSSDGELQGVGLLIANQPVNNHLLVLSAIKGGPADRAGITTGDEVLSINDQPTEGWTGDMAAKLLRGKGGTEVRVKFARRTLGIPGVPGRPEPPLFDAEFSTVREVRLKREKLALSPVFYTALQAPALTDGLGITVASAPLQQPSSTPPPALAAKSAMFAPGGSNSSSTTSSASSPQNIAANGVAAGGVSPAATTADKLGYLKLTSFSQNAAQDLHRAIADLEHQRVSGYILDLRDNPGGLVKSGIDVARLLLDGRPTIFSIVGRDGDPLQQVTLGEDGDPIGPGEALTHRPLVVLVNQRSASASEILSGALHDNNRAIIVGDEHTYGKGRIQSVYELHDGSALFVTVAKYLTPSGQVIDLKGIQPDRSCRLGAAAGLEEDDEGIMAAFLPGLSVGIMGESDMVSALSHDKCVLTAANILHDKAAMINATANVAANIPGI